MLKFLFDIVKLLQFETKMFDWKIKSSHFVTNLDK